MTDQTTTLLNGARGMTLARFRLLTDEQMAARCAYAAYGTYRCARQPESPYHAMDGDHPYQAPSAKTQCMALSDTELASI